MADSVWLDHEVTAAAARGHARVDLILPVLNEAEALPWVLGRVPVGWHPIVVDNGSSDGSAQIAADLGAQVVSEPVAGFGSACFAGLTAATAEIVVFMDADGSLDPADAPRVADPVRRGEADLTLAARRPQRGAWPLAPRLANRIIAHRLNMQAGTNLTDLGPMRAARRLALLKLGIEDRRFGWPLEMVTRAAAAGWRITETGVGYYPRRGGTSKVSGNLMGSIRTVKDMAGLLR